jgi:predicted nucleotidyltransferase
MHECEEIGSIMPKLPANHQATLERFTAVCQRDERIMAAFLGGSYARNTADAYSDLDLYLVTTDEAFKDFYIQRHDFMQRLGEPVFIEEFDNPNLVFYILADGTEGELGIGHQSAFSGIHSGPYEILVDKQEILAGLVFPDYKPDFTEQTEKLRRLIYGFWHDLSHFITAIGRKQLWWAQGQVEALRRCCTNLARLRSNFDDTGVGEEAYFKIEKEMPVEMLSDLRATFCRMDEREILEAGFILVRYYKQQAVPLTKTHGIIYPKELERVMVRRLEGVRYSK